MHQIKQVDRLILKELIKDSRKSLREIGKRINVATATVSSRIEKLINEGVIKNFTVNVDLGKLGYNEIRIFKIKAKKKDYKKVIDLLRNEKNIINIFGTMKNYDVIAIGVFKNKLEIKFLIEKIKSMDNVEIVDIIEVFDILKDDKLTLLILDL